METNTNFLQTEEQLVINDDIKKYLTTVSNWARFLAILGFVSIGLLGIAAIALVFLDNQNTGYGYRSYQTGTHITSIVYVFLAVIYYFPFRYLFLSSKYLKDGITSHSQDSLVFGFKNLKLHYKYIGILIIVLISLYLIIFLTFLLTEI